MIVFATKDVGPAAYLAEIIKSINQEFVCVSSSVSSKVFDKHHIQNTVIDNDTQYGNDQYIKDNFKDISIDIIVTGTSWGNCIDKAFIKFGIENHIKVISIVEHWSNYRERFLINNTLTLPDYIVVNDSLAKDEAVKDGLPDEIIYVLGNPVLENKAKNCRVNFNRKKWLDDFKIPDTKIITFVSENYAQDFPVKSTYYHGFDEYQVIGDLLEAVKQEGHLIIKLHPAEKPDKYDAYKSKNVTIVSQTDVDALIAYSDFIVGMGSMLLIEAAFVRGDILSYRPNDRKGFVGNKIGATYLVKNKQEMHDIILRTKTINNTAFKGRFQGSLERVVKFIEDKLP